MDAGPWNLQNMQISQHYDTKMTSYVVFQGINQTE